MINFQFFKSFVIGNDAISLRIQPGCRMNSIRCAHGVFGTQFRTQLSDF